MTELASFYLATEVALNHVTHGWVYENSPATLCRCSWRLLVAGTGGSHLAAPRLGDGCLQTDPVLNSNLGTLAVPEYPQHRSLQRKMPELAWKIKPQ